MMIIGISGRMGSGKSLITSLLEKANIPVIDADKLAKELSKKDSICYKRIVTSFGEGILDNNKEINRPKLAKIIFNNEKERKKLEEIMHPAIATLKNELLQHYNDNHEKIVIYSAPLLFEKNLQKEVDKTIYLSATDETLLQRIMTRDKISLKEAQKKLSSQWPDEEKTCKADEVIENNSDMNSFIEAFKKSWKKLTNLDLVV